MWRERLLNNHVQDDAVTGAVAAALLCSIFEKHVEQLFNSRSDLESYSETLAWIIIYAFWKFRLAQRNPAGPQADPLKSANLPLSNASLWVASTGLAVRCFFADEDIASTIFPALSPLILFAYKFLGTHTHSPAASTRPWSLLFFRLANTLWGTTLVALFAIATLKWPSYLDFVSSEALFIIPLAAQLVVYVVLSLDHGSELPHTTSQPFDIESVVIPLSLRIIRLMVLTVVLSGLIFGFPQWQPISVLALGLSKAVRWHFTIKMIRYCSWRTAASIGLYSIMSTQDPYKQPLAERALLHLIASFLFLGQTIHTLPEKSKAKSYLWLFSLASLVPYLSNNIDIKIAQSSPQLMHPERHPVQILIRSAQIDFDNMIESQSKNYTAAHEEYRRRYNMDPPPGFEAWYEFAKSHQSLIIDEFDVIHEIMSPLLSLSGQEAGDSMDLIQETADSELWACDFSGQEAKTHCTHAYRTFDRHIELMFNTLFRDLRGSLPDVKFLVNHIDEPRVVFPREGDTPENGRFTITDIARRPVWDDLTKNCVAGTNNRNSTRYRTMNEQSFILPFVTDPVSASDLCQHLEYHNTHGLLQSPLSFRLLEGLIPVLSTGSLSTMGDIVYPSPAYMEPEFLYEEAGDVNWDNKHNNLYWAGSTTGGFAQDSSWRNYHRQRFVDLAQNIQKRQHSYLREEGGVLRRITSSFLNSRMFDVAFTRIFQCEKRQCRDQRAYFKVKSWEDANRAFESRLVFDMDGNGISGRFYKLLASRSTPLKQTLLREWHDERLMPWVHYVPVSQGLEELPELVSHLTSTEAGQEGARFIAEQGRDWYAKAFREVDMTIFMYRLLLELARLQDPARQPEWGTKTS